MQLKVAGRATVVALWLQLGWLREECRKPVWGGDAIRSQKEGSPRQCGDGGDRKVRTI